MRVLARYGAPALWLGLDYAAAKAGLDLAGIEISPDDWARLRVIEVAAVKALNEG